jgi:prophage regulatory protein
MLFPDRPGTLHKGRYMAQFFPSTLTILRRKQVQAETGYSRSTIYLRIAQGLWTKPVSLGGRAVGWPASEVAALNAARIAGQHDEDIRALVAKLEVDRRTVSGNL